MSNPSWWAPVIRPELSQGDVLADVALAIVENPRTFLEKSTGKGGREVWLSSAQPRKTRDDRYYFLALGKVCDVIVVSHDCEIDKQKRILLAPIAPLTKIGDAAAAERVRQLNVFSKIPLLDLPPRRDHYADLRNITSVDANACHSAKRLASMTDFGVDQLDKRLIAFFTRVDLGSSLS